MLSLFFDWLRALYLLLPAYLANTAPVIVALILKKRLSTPLDLGKKWRGKRLLGDHKTIRGLIAAVLVGGLVFSLQKRLYNISFFRSLSLIDYSGYGLAVGFLFGLGTILGDAVKSFFKRRKNIPPGRSWFPFDQIDLTLGALPIIIFLKTPLITIIIILLNGLLLPLLVEIIIGSRLKKKIS